MDTSVERKRDGENAGGVSSADWTLTLIRHGAPWRYSRMLQTNPEFRFTFALGSSPRGYAVAKGAIPTTVFAMALTSTTKANANVALN